MAKRIIIGVLVTDRVQKILDVQKILSEYGCYIKTRLGMHDVDATSCSPTGLLILETFGDEGKILEMESKLKGITGIVVQKMVFEF
jgi:hypothetical protein